MIKHCLFPVAGLGTRFLPITKSLPKEMLPIIDKPLLQYSVEEAQLAGISNMLMITSKRKDVIKHYFTAENPPDRNNKLQPLASIMDQCQFDFVNQKSTKGLGDAILHGHEIISNNPFAVILPDDLCSISTLANMSKLYEKYQCCIIAIERVPSAVVSRYGIIKVSNQKLDEGVYKVLDMVEKPKQEDAPSDLAIVGRYILTPDVFQLIQNTNSGQNNEVQITDTLIAKAHRGEVIAYELPSKRYDCGTSSGYVEAILSYAQGS